MIQNNDKDSNTAQGYQATWQYLYLSNFYWLNRQCITSQNGQTDLRNLAADAEMMLMLFF